MSNAILIMGESGVGKSSSIRTLNPDETFIINILDKQLPFKGARSSYKRYTKETTDGNYVSTDNFQHIIKAIDIANKNEKIKTLIIDDAQYIMANEFMRRARETGFNKFTELAQHMWEVINAANNTRSDLDCFFLSHTQMDDSGKFKFKTIGKMLDNVITIEGLFTVVLHALIVDKQYKFLTQTDGQHIAKSPMGMFHAELIDNDLQFVKNSIEKYMNEDIKD